MSSLAIQPASKPLDAVVTIPGSKSLTNRALVAAALADGTSVLSNALFADDTRHMMDALRGFGFAVTAYATEDGPDANRIEVTGCGGHVPNPEADCFCGNSGTTIRFCTALAALGHGRYRLDGVARMRQRPIEPLGDAIQMLGGGIEYHGEQGYPPLTVHARGLSGGTVTFDNPASSQFVSALLLAAPAAMSDVLIDVRGALVSAPYVHMTTAVMSAMGPVVIEDIQPDSARFIVAARQPYHAQNLTIEPDASNASYFLAAPAVAGGRVTVRGLGTDSIQGDIRFVDLLERMGCAVERAPDALAVLLGDAAPSGEGRRRCQQQQRDEPGGCLVRVTVHPDLRVPGLSPCTRSGPPSPQAITPGRSCTRAQSAPPNCPNKWYACQDSNLGPTA